MSDVNDLKRTMATAETAFLLLKRNGLPAYPRYYELLYTYASGSNPILNQSIDAILALRGTLTAHEVSQMIDEFIAQDRLDQKIDEIGDRIGDEIDKSMSLLSETVESNKVFRAALSQGHSDLLHTGGSDEVDSIVGRLTVATDQANAVNHRLAQQLDEARKHIADLQHNLDAVRFESLTDDLTTLANRKHFDHSLARCARDVDMNAKSLSLLMLDIDHFKRFNDTYGHQTGDQVLRLVALSLKQTIKGQDIACRYGGEEFAIILPNTGLAQATVVADHIRTAVMTKELVKRSTGENLGRITISIGVSTWRHGDTSAELIGRADKALYAAKRGGRNAVRQESDPDVADANRVA
jgi:diguanylate cyclase